MFISLLVPILHFFTISSVIILVLLPIFSAIDPFLSIPCFSLRWHEWRLDFTTILFFFSGTLLFFRRWPKGHSIITLKKRSITPPLKGQIMHFFLIQTFLKKLSINSEDNMSIRSRFHQRNIKHLLSIILPSLITKSLRQIKFLNFPSYLSFLRMLWKQ